MTRMIEVFALECEHCRERFPPDMVMEAVKIHFEVEHDTDDLKLVLVPVCQCGTAFALTRSEWRPGGEREFYDCPSCHRNGFVDRRDPSPKSPDNDGGPDA